MNKLIPAILLGAYALSPFAFAAEETPAPVAPAAVESAPVVPGVWTNNYAEALKVAKARRLPIFLSFTGSDWCGWCQVMEHDCLTKPEFLKAMSTEYLLVSLDFPHKTKLPEALQAQNNMLAGRFKGKDGFPTYIILDSSDESVKWSFGAHPKYRKEGAGVELMVRDLHEFAAGCANVVERSVEGLPAEKATAYRTLAAAYVKRQAEIKAWLAEVVKEAKQAPAKPTEEEKQRRKDKVAAEIAQLEKFREELRQTVAKMDELRKSA